MSSFLPPNDFIISYVLDRPLYSGEKGNKVEKTYLHFHHLGPKILRNLFTFKGETHKMDGVCASARLVKLNISKENRLWPLFPLVT